MDFTFFLLPLSVIQDSKKAADDDGNFLELGGSKIYRLHIIGSVYTMETNEETGSGYLVVDDTFSSILVHFQKQSFQSIENVNKGDFIEVLGTIDVYNDSITLSLNNLAPISLSRYCYNKIQSIVNLGVINGRKL